MKKVLCVILSMVLAAGFAFSAFGAQNVKYGDVDGDGSINSSDALMILSASTDLITLTDEQKKLADVSADERVDSYDALLVLKFSVELIDSFPAEAVDEPSELSTEEIVKLYNDAANAAKAYSGKMKLSVTDGVNTEIVATSFPKAAVSIANGLLPNDYPSKADLTANGGKVTGTKTKPDGSKSSINESVKDYLVICGDEKMSKLTADGVAAAQCTPKDGGYEIKLILKTETVNGIDKLPPAHSSCVQVLDITPDDLKPFTLEKGTVKYLGATINATVNSDGLLERYDVHNPVTVDGTLKWTMIKGTVSLNAEWIQTIEFTY